MAAQIIDGKAVAARVARQGAEEVKAFTGEHGRAPGLATVLVGDDAASAVYVGGKQKACAEVGIRGFDHRLAGEASAQGGGGRMPPSRRGASCCTRSTPIPRSAASCSSCPRRSTSTARG